MSEEIEVTNLEIQAPVGADKRKKKLGALKYQDVDALKVVMSTKEGRRTVYRILDTTSFFQTSFTGSSTTFFNEGKRYIGRLLYEELNDECPELYTQMMSENRKAKEPQQ